MEQKQCNSKRTENYHDGTRLPPFVQLPLVPMPTGIMLIYVVLRRARKYARFPEKCRLRIFRKVILSFCGMERMARLSGSAGDILY